MSATVFLQDNDPRIVYSGGWAEVAPLPPQGGAEHGDGAHETSQPGASATLRFRGNAVSVFVTVYGITEASSASLSITISLDGRLYAWSSPALSQPLFGQRPFQVDSGLDPNVEHTLVITQGDGMQLRLDSLQYRIPAGGQAGPVAQPYGPDGTLTPLSGAIPNQPSSSPTPTPSRPATSPSQPGNTSNSPPQTTNTSSPTDPSLPSLASSTGDSNSLARGSSNTRESISGPVTPSIRSEATVSGSRAVVTTDSKGLVITKILPPDRIITTTDSTGGIVVRTEPADGFSGGVNDNGNRESAIGTGTVIAVVLGIVVVLAILGLALLLLLRRRSRRKDLKGRKSLEGYTGSNSDISPFGLINGATEESERGSQKMPSGGSSPQEDVPVGDGMLDIRRESRRSTGIRSTFARSGRDVAPPAYSPDSEAMSPSAR
ncbi:hypothetical protein BKA70DRAFT_1507788 [Coprinopsis sp. MPI-PUGE-AT-0042]|nr:hypothetical protein BKA70DRAFT_1507788 [Coprinopsis sp. MPI-PUGE-AT-0042]